MTIEKVFERIKERLGVRVEASNYGDQILGMSNGYQWNGQPLNPELAEMMIEVLQEYIEFKKQ